MYGSVRFTWAQTIERCRRLASVIRSLNIKTGEVVSCKRFYGLKTIIPSKADFLIAGKPCVVSYGREMQHLYWLQSKVTSDGDNTITMRRIMSPMIEINRECYGQYLAASYTQQAAGGLRIETNLSAVLKDSTWRSSAGRNSHRWRRQRGSVKDSP